MSIPESTISLITKTTFMLIVISAGMVCFGEKILFANVGMLPVFPRLQDKAVQTYKFVTLAEAEKVLGRKGQVKDSSWKSSASITRFFTTIVASQADKKTGKTGRLFFSYENYPQDGNAKEIYVSLKAENEKTAPVTAFPETGDEAFWVKDVNGNPFIMALKGNKIFKLKMYYVSDKNAFEQLKSLAKRVVSDN